MEMMVLRRMRLFATVGVVLLAFLALAASEARADNQAACENWCKANPKCEKCMPTPTCGAGLKVLKSFKGAGKNWYACGKAEMKLSNQAACEQWCKANPNCAKCLPEPGCGAGQKVLKSFKGKGKTWFACGKGKLLLNNQASCEQWCKANPSCAKCLPEPGCSMGYKILKIFKGKGMAWFACQKKP